MRFAALNTGPDFHLLDHIAPLSWLLDMPLFVTEEKNLELARSYYPMVKVELVEDIERSLSFFAEQFDALFECKYFEPHLKRLFNDLYGKDMRLVHCAHGQSDKGYAHPTLRHYGNQDSALVYGDLLRTMLHEMGIVCNTVVSGNYRLLFYLEHKAFYDELAEKEVTLPKEMPILLYAPTWKDSDGATTFFTHARQLFKQLPENWGLVIKLHPLLEQRNPADFYRVEAMASRYPNVRLVLEFPPVYPLLAKTSRFLGDYSSVGYDFLYFRRPMFFLLQEGLPKGRLHSTGTILSSWEPLFSLQPPDYTEKQQSLYELAFGRLQSKQVMKETIVQALHSPRGGRTNKVCNSLKSATKDCASKS